MSNLLSEANAFYFVASSLATLTLLIPIPITRQTDGQRWKKSHNEVSKIVEV